MRHESSARRRWTPWARGLALAGASALGFLTLVGSGGGSLGFPPCPPDLCGPAPPPTPIVVVTPSRLTVLVGTPVTFRAQAENTTGAVTYQWRRSSGLGTPLVDIPGATASIYTLPSANLGDDGVLFQVVMTPSGGLPVREGGRLAVSAVQGVVLADGEFAPADWETLSVDVAGAVRPEHVEQQVGAGGNPGAYRHMLFRLGQATGSGAVAYLARRFSYDPSEHGAVYVIDYAEDCSALNPSELLSTTSQLLLQQGTRTYVSSGATPYCVAAAWAPVANQASLAAGEFVLLDGPACTAGESCPDFSVSALPLHFGYRRVSFASPGVEVAHGIDNWRVTVWPR
jgi:hypothetical protein